MTQYNRLEINIHKMADVVYLEDRKVEHADLLVAVQQLPVDVHDGLWIDLLDTKKQTLKLFVFRYTALEYFFCFPKAKIGKLFTVRPVGFPWTSLFQSVDKEVAKEYTSMDRGMVTDIGTLLVQFFMLVDQRRLYPFVATTHQDPKTVKNPTKQKKLEAQNHAVVYLGHPPGEAPKRSPIASEPREFGYPRRQHRRTLRADRFKNHPKFGVYKGILVGQSWCGPKEYTDKRKTYRLWEAPKIDRS